MGRRKLIPKFGKLPVRKDDRDLLLANYLLPALNTPLPDEIAYQTNLPKSLGVYGNNYCKDCTCAAAAHLIISWTANATGVVKFLPEAAVISAYSALTNYDPQTGGQDDGARLQDMLNYWKNTGIGDDRIDAYAKVDYTNMEELKQAIFIFGGCLIGLNLPDGVPPNTPGQWQIPLENGFPNFRNAHAVPLIGYDAANFAAISFGLIVSIPFGFINAYVDEAFSVLSSQNWVNGGRSIRGIDMAGLQTDLNNITT